MQQASLFTASQKAPLADRLRPKTLETMVGHKKILGKGGSITALLEGGHMPSLILWGPPGCGKTTLARILAHHSQAWYESVSAVTSGVAELKKLFTQAKACWQQGGQTLLLVDEIHRFNRAQQDVFLPYIEEGSIILIGATTENPSFELNAALLSRCKVIVLGRLEEDALLALVQRAEQEVQKKIPVTEEGKRQLAVMADGDGRALLNFCEELFALPMVADDEWLEGKALVEVIQKRAPVYDKHQDSHYNLISALHKSLRGSDTDAALYWLARMLEGGEDPLYIVRRLVRFAVEDIGMADPQAVIQANAAKEAYHFLGSPEGDLAIAQAVVYLATAPKSNAQYVAFKAAQGDARAKGSLMPPRHILNAPTALMKEEGYGKGYLYDHDRKEGVASQQYFPEGLEGTSYYMPVERGFEREIIKRLQYFRKLKGRD